MDSNTNCYSFLAAGEFLCVFQTMILDFADFIVPCMPPVGYKGRFGIFGDFYRPLYPSGTVLDPGNTL